MTEQAHVPVVTVKDGAAVADSRDVAAVFGKQHKHVIEKIDNLLRGAPHLNGPNFRLVPYEDAKGETRRAYEMDRKAFSLLAMRFTGAKALQWQLAYIDAFDRMEAALRSGGLPQITLPPEIRTAIGGIVKGIVHKELTQVIPAMVAEQLMSGRGKVVEGISALEVAEMAGYPKGKRPRGLIQFITSRLRRYHEDRGVIPHRTPHGSCKVMIYVEALARGWMREGGRAAIEQYVAERRGQGRLRLVGVDMGKGELV